MDATSDTQVLCRYFTDGIVISRNAPEGLAVASLVAALLEPSRPTSRETPFLDPLLNEQATVLSDTQNAATPVSAPVRGGQDAHLEAALRELANKEPGADSSGTDRAKLLRFRVEAVTALEKYDRDGVVIHPRTPLAVLGRRLLEVIAKEAARA